MNRFSARHNLGVVHIAVLISSCLMAPISMAHSEHDKARFVSSTGEDIGRCDNRFRPCKTILYAAIQANKGDVVKVASGRYEVASEQELVYIANQIVPIQGGYSALDHFQIQHPNANETLLLGLPKKYQQIAFEQGFNVVPDGKGQSLQTVFAQVTEENFNLANTQPLTPCADGKAGIFDCSNVSLVGHLPNIQLHSGATSANDIWGHVDLNTGKEYAIIGLRNGVSVVDVTEPESPQVVGNIAGQNTTWRDIKVFQRYNSAIALWQAWAYVTADSASEGLVIIDLNDLENGVSIVQRDRRDQRAHNIYISGVDYSLNIANDPIAPQIHILGANNFAGALRSYSLTSPMQLLPSYTPSTFNGVNYSHDASSVSIMGERAIRDCPNEVNGQCVVLIDFNETTLRLWDNTSLTSAQQLSDTTYAGAEYTHSGWWSEDRRYVLVHDELDEQRRGFNSTVYIFDISELTAPQLVTTWRGSTRAADHNGYVRGNRYYMSNYERGLTILDISDPLAPEEIGFFDTFPLSNNASFSGAWGVYPFLPSGNILVSDIQRGLFILRDDTAADEVSVGFSSTQIRTQEGQTLELAVSKQGVGAASVDFQVIPGATEDSDIQLPSGRLSWAANDDSNRIISILINDDAINEGPESFFVSLHTPDGGFLRPQSRLASVTIDADNAAAGQAVFVSSEISARENQGEFQVRLARSGGTSGRLDTSLAFSETATASDILLSETVISWQDGESDVQSVQLTLVDDNETESDETFILNAGASMLAITVRDDESNQAPTANAGNDFSVNARATVTLRGSASDPETMPLDLLWQQTSGPAVTLSNATADQTQFTAPNQAASLTFTLTATDDFGVTSSDEVAVTVVAQQQSQPTQNSGSGGGSLHIIWLMVLFLSAASMRGTKINRR